MNPGKLDRRITLQRRSQARDGFGDSIDGWTVFIDKLPAQILKRSGREAETASDQRVATRTIVFRIRYGAIRPSINPADWRIIHEGGIYDIHAAEEVGRRHFVDLVTEYRSTVTA